MLLAREWRTEEEVQLQNDVLYISVGKRLDLYPDLLITTDRGRYVCTAVIDLVIDVGVAPSVFLVVVVI